MTKAETRQLIRMAIVEMYEDKRSEFESFGEGGHYTESQKDYAFELISEYGIRATARILKVPRRTLQRWRMKGGVWVKRCPDWVYEWAARRRRRKRFWARRGYC